MLAIGCCLYLGTGMLMGIPVYLALTRWGEGKSVGVKLLIALRRLVGDLDRQLLRHPCPG